MRAPPKKHVQQLSWCCRSGLLLLAAVCVESRGQDVPATPAFHWSPGRLERQQGRTVVPLAGLPAVQLKAAEREHLVLADASAWQDLDGPWTLRLAVKLLGPPREKVPLISKWHMKDGGRSFEVGVLADGRPFFDVSETGNWDRRGQELIGNCRLLADQTYCLAAVFEPSRSMSIHVNGQLCASVRDGVPAHGCDNDTPVWLGAQPPGLRWTDVALAEVLLDRRVLDASTIRSWCEQYGATTLPTLVQTPLENGCLDLSVVRRQVLDYCARLQVPDRPYGALRVRDLPGSEMTLYASCDVAWTRACMGEDLTETLSDPQRREWIDHINSFVRPDGTYENPNHGELHRNGMVIGALGALGGRQVRRVSLYEQFDELDEIQPWLERIAWDRQWSASHLFWGGMHCYSMSSRCSPEWRQRVFQWLDANLDPQTGWWRKGVPQSGRPIEVLGGAAHIWPVYQIHQRPFPYPKQVIDSILSMQKEDGSWINMSNYMELDALYGLAYMQSLASGYRSEDILAAARRHGELVTSQYAAFMSSAPHTHVLLSVVSTLALLQQLDGEHYPSERPWSDIFSDPQFYATDRVECFDN